MWKRRNRKSWSAAALLVFACSTALAQWPSVRDGKSLALSHATYQATLEDCDRAWKAQKQRRPRAAIVINQTKCEPRKPCEYGMQVYYRTCYRR